MAQFLLEHGEFKTKGSDGKSSITTGTMTCSKPVAHPCGILGKVEHIRSLLFLYTEQGQMVLNRVAI